MAKDKGGSSPQVSLHGGGMQKSIPKFPDSSMTPPSRSVNGDAVRPKTAHPDMFTRPDSPLPHANSVATPMYRNAACADCIDVLLYETAHVALSDGEAVSLNDAAHVCEVMGAYRSVSTSDAVVGICTPHTVGVATNASGAAPHVPATPINIS